VAAADPCSGRGAGAPTCMYISLEKANTRRNAFLRAYHVICQMMIGDEGLDRGLFVLRYGEIDRLLGHFEVRTISERVGLVIDGPQPLKIHAVRLVGQETCRRFEVSIQGLG
jgi:hypothetical protein